MSRSPEGARVFWGGVSLVLIALVWATTFGIVRSTVSGYAFPPFAFLFWRFLLASVFGTAYYFPALKGITPRTAWAGFVCGGFLFVGFAGQTLGLMTIPAARSAFLTGLFVLMVPYLAWLTLDRPLETHIVLAAGMAAVGLFFITNPGTDSLSRGDLYTLLCALGFAGQIVALEEAGRLADYRQLFIVQLVTVLVLSGAVMLWREGFHVPSVNFVWMTIAFTALFATVLAYAVQTWAQQIVPAAETALLLALEPVFALFVSAFVYREFFTHLQATGASLILAAILVVSLVGVPAASSRSASES
ncbi:DMT family transporter [bacterium]|nr:DMT family transporter [bacterium]